MTTTDKAPDIIIISHAACGDAVTISVQRRRQGLCIVPCVWRSAQSHTRQSHQGRNSSK